MTANVRRARVVPAVLAGGLLLLAGCSLPQAQASPTAAGSGSVTCSKAGATPPAGVSAERFGNAQVIAATAMSLGMGAKAAEVGVLTANIESDLVNVAFGDKNSSGTMTTSRGLFQQIADWGPLADRMDPAKSATMFFTGGKAGQAGLADVPGWEGMDVGAAMQAVQGSQYAGGTSPGYAAKAAAAKAITAAVVAGCTASGGGSGAAAGGAFVSYTQWDPKSAWADLPYWGSTIGHAGCGPASVAEVVATWKDKTVTPDKVAAYMTSISAEGQGDRLPAVFAHYGLNASPITSMDQAVAGLKTGGIVIMSASGSSPWTSAGHFVVLRAIDPDGRVWLGDVNAPKGERSNSRSWAPTEILGAMDSTGIHSLNLITKRPAAGSA